MPIPAQDILKGEVEETLTAPQTHDFELLCAAIDEMLLAMASELRDKRALQDKSVSGKELRSAAGDPKVVRAVVKAYKEAGYKLSLRQGQEYDARQERNDPHIRVDVEILPQ